MAARLGCNDKVTWNGRAKDTNFQSVTTDDGKKGFLPVIALSDQPIPFSKCGFSKDEGMGSSGPTAADERSRQAALESFHRALRGP